MISRVPDLYHCVQLPTEGDQTCFGYLRLVSECLQPEYNGRPTESCRRPCCLALSGIRLRDERARVQKVQVAMLRGVVVKLRLQSNGAWRSKAPI